VGAIGANDFPRQADESGRAGGDHASSRRRVRAISTAVAERRAQIRTICAQSSRVDGAASGRAESTICGLLRGEATYR